MSKYTTELRYLLDMGYDLGLSMYPIFDEKYRSALNAKIIDHFYYREIGQETPGMFKRYLQRKLNEVMPLYNQLYRSQLLTFNPLYDSELNETYRKNTTGSKNTTGTTKGTAAGAVASTGSSDTNTSDTTSSTGISVDSDTPQGLITRSGLDGDIYASKAGKSQSSGTGSGTSNADTSTTSQDYTESTGELTNIDAYETLDDYVRHVSGNQGGKNYSELLNDFRTTFLNIDMLVIEELNSCFMQVY